PDELATHFRAWSDSAHKILAAAPAWQRFPVLSVDATRAWHADRVVLLGDAAHAMPPFLAQGAAMAIEDAAVLATMMAGSENVPGALGAYVRQRQARVAAVAAASRRTGAIFHWTGLPAAMRNLALRLAGEELIMRRSDWIYRWRP